MKTILGLEIEERPFSFEGDLPLYIVGNYDIRQVSISGFECIFMRPKGNIGTTGSIKKHLGQIVQICGMPAAIFSERLSAYRRNSFLENRVPFVTDKQVYLPFMGTLLEAQSDNLDTLDCFTAAAQLTLIKWLTNPEKRMRTKDLMNGLGYTPMTESRVTRQLAATQCFRIEKEGPANILVCDLPAKDVYQQVKPYMVSPVRQAGYIDLPTSWDVTVAGTEALAQRTMINPDAFHTYAVYGVDKSMLRTELVDPLKQAYVEIWKYDPKTLLWPDGLADPISVALSLSGSSDERIEAAVRDMLDDVWR